MTGTPLTEKETKMASTRRVVITGGLVIIAAAATATIGIANRARTVQDIARWTEDQSVPTVAVVTPTLGRGQDELVLPGNIEAYYTGLIFARASGYVKEWREDIGARVKQGQILAIIDTPDLDQQLAQAQADLKTALANEQLSTVTADRWQTLAQRNIVSQQAKDEKVGDLEAKTATVQAAQANVARLESLQSFNQLVAPFDGVVTTRGTDIGQLVTAGGNSGRPLYTVSDIHRVRVYVNVPQAFLAQLKPGLEASLALPQYASETFPATLTTTSNAVTLESRAALVELQADNADGKLWPGSYAEVHFHLKSNEQVLHIPATALFFGPRGIEVAQLDADGRIRLSKVELGRNLGNTVEVLSGLPADATIVDSPPESLITGQTVRIAKKNGDKVDTGSNRVRPST